MNEAEIQRQKEIKEAEELLFTGPQALGFAKGLFLGRFVADWAMPYPRIPAAQQAELDKSLAEIRQFLDEHLDHARHAELEVGFYQHGGGAELRALSEPAQ